MRSGSGDGDLPRRIWIFSPDEREETQGHVAARFSIMGEARKAGISVVVRRTVTCKVHGADGRTRLLLAPRYAQELYEALHHAQVGVFQIGPAGVRRDPSREPAVDKVVSDLATFVRYKAFHEVIDSSNGVQNAMRRYDSWSASIGCEGISDPRCLPLHVFAMADESTNLDSTAGYDAFAAAHGAASKRLDAGGRRWVTGAYHGKVAVNVAGRDLPRGFHWDVNWEQGKTRLTLANEVWRLKGETYVNVTPNGTVRRSNGQASRCVRVWP